MAAKLPDVETARTVLSHDDRRAGVLHNMLASVIAVLRFALAHW